MRKRHATLNSTLGKNNAGKIVQHDIFTIYLFIIGCTCFVSFEDVSESKEYQEVVGSIYTSSVELLIHGVNMDSPVKENIDQYTVTPPPGITGREIISRYILPIGTRFRVDRIFQCTNCFLDFKPRIKVQIKILSSALCSDKNVYLRDSWGDVEFLLLQNEKIVLNHDYFKYDYKE